MVNGKSPWRSFTRFFLSFSFFVFWTNETFIYRSTFSLVQTLTGLIEAPHTFKFELLHHQIDKPHTNSHTRTFNILCSMSCIPYLVNLDSIDFLVKSLSKQSLKWITQRWIRNGYIAMFRRLPLTTAIDWGSFLWMKEIRIIMKIQNNIPKGMESKCISVIHFQWIQNPYILWIA